MVWKKIKKPTEEEVKHISKRAIKKKFNPLFSHAKTRKSSDLNTVNSKLVVEKKVKRRNL